MRGFSPDQIAYLKTQYTPGKRIKLIRTTDPYTKLKYGDKGTVVHVDDIGTIHCNWDSGTKLGMIPGEDIFEITE